MGQLLKESDPNHAIVYDRKIEPIGKTILDVGPIKGSRNARTLVITSRMAADGASSALIPT
jgi:hypothetical protein